MAGAGYKLFNTGDVLTAQQVNEYLMQQTVMVFADASARTTALSGVLAEGMLSYLKSTDATEVYNGSAWVALAADQTPLTTKGDLFTYTTTDARLASSGVNGDVLQVDTSTASGLKWGAISAGGFTQIATGSIASAVTGIDISSIPSTYYELLLFIDGASIAAGTEVIGIRFNNDSGSNYSGTYIEPGGSAAIGSQAVTFYRISGGMSSTLLTQGGYVRVTNYANTTGWKTISSQCVQSSDVVINAFGMWKNTSAINRIQLITNGSTFDAGVYTLYGVK